MCINIINLDSTQIPFEAKIDENHDIINILFEVEPNDEYKISIYPDAINDFFDNPIDSLSYKVQSRDREYYGNIFLQLIFIKCYSWISTDKSELAKYTKCYV